MNVTVSTMKIHCNKSQITTVLKADKNSNHIFLNNKYLKIWKTILSDLYCYLKIYVFVTYIHTIIFSCTFQLEIDIHILFIISRINK